MDAHRRAVIHARQGITLPGATFDPLDPFGIHHSKTTASASSSASASSAAASASASASITTSASASTSASISVSQSVSSSASSSTPSPIPNTDSSPSPTPLTTGPAPTTVFQTVNATQSGAAPSTSSTALTDAVKPTGFLQNKVLSGIVFGVIGVIGLTLVIFVATWMLRRRRNKRLVNEAISFDPVNFGKEDYPADIVEKGRNSGATTGAGAAVGAVGASTISNSGHDARSMKSVRSYATGSASHGAPPVSQALAFADYVPPVPYLSSAPSTPRTQQQFSEQQNQIHNFRGNSIYNPYLANGYGPPPPAQQQSYAPPYYTQQPGLPSQSSIAYDYRNPVGVEGEHARRSSSSMELKFASPGAGRN